MERDARSGPVRPEDFWYVVAVVLRSGVVERLQPRLVQKTTGRIGHPLSVFAVYVAGVLNALLGRRPSVENTFGLLEQLPESLARVVGIHPDQRGGKVLTLRDVSLAWNRIVDALRSSTHSAGKRWPIEEGKETRPSYLRPCRMHKTFPVPSCSFCTAYRHPDSKEGRQRVQGHRGRSTRGLPTGLSAEARAERQVLLEELGDALQLATWPDGLALSAIAVDWTDLESAANPGDREKGLSSAAPDARWGWRHSRDNRIPSRKRPPSAQQLERAALRPTKGRGEQFFGFLVFLAAAAQGLKGDELVPEICLAVRLVPGNAHCRAPELLVAMAEVVREAFPSLSDCLFDRGFSMKRPERWWRPLMRMGIHPVFDLPKTTPEIKGSFNDAPLWHGIPICPAMAEVVRAPTVPDLRAPDETWERWWREFKYFEATLFRRLGATATETQRYQCPGCHGIVCAHCKNQDAYVRLSGRDDVPHVYHPPKEPLRCCNTSMSLPLHVGEGIRQRDPWGTPSWARSYARRTAVERLNGHVRANQQLERDTLRFLDRTALHVMISMILCGTNIRLVRSWRISRSLPEPNFEALARELGVETILERFPPARAARHPRTQR